MSSQIRRVVTGKDATGKAIVLMDSAASNVRARQEAGVTATFLWLTQSSPADVSLTADPVVQASAVHPPPGGTVFRVVEFSPEKNITADYETRLQMMRQMGLYPEGPTRDRPRDPGMHRTRTLDYAIVLSGEIDLLLDDSEVHLKAGDVVIQQATNHAWANRGETPCAIAFILVDAKD